MYEINKLLHGQGACTEFSHSLFVSEIERASAASEWDFWYITNSRENPVRAPSHEVISTNAMAVNFAKNNKSHSVIMWNIPISLMVNISWKEGVTKISEL